MVNRFWFSFLLFLGLTGWSELQASHNMGVDLSYQCINQCTIRVTIRGYRDCTGITLSTPILNFAGQGGGCNQPTAIGNWSAAVITEVTPICSGWPTRCTNANATINGVQEYSWWRDYNICSMNCSTYVLSWSDCCRNSAITSGSSGNGIYVGSTTLNPFTTPCNSTPQFTNPPVPYICAGQPFVFNQGAVDPDGDSLSYSLGPCFDSQGLMVTYNAGFSPTAPLGPTWAVSVNPTTGDITMTPNPGGSIQVGVMCVYVQEWRNGVMIGQVVRDMQITVLSCPSNNVPTVSPMSNVQGGTANVQGTFITTCVGSPIIFNVTANDPNAAQTITFTWSNNLTGGTFTNCTNPAQTNTLTGNGSVCGTFSWTPTTNGTFFVTFTAEDNNCPITGSAQRTIQIYVGALGLNQSAIVPGCGPVSLCAHPTSGIPPFTFLWQGAGGLSANPNNTDSCLTHLYPGLGTYPYTITVTDSNGCSNVITDTVIINAVAQANAGPDITTCSGDTGYIGGAPTVNNIYLWTPAVGLSSTTVASPSVTLFTAGAFPQTFTYYLHVQDTTTGCVDDDTVVVTVNPNPVAAFALPNQVCTGDPVQITYTGPNTLANFSWNFGAGASPATANTIGPHNVAWNGNGYSNVTLSLVQNGCSSNVALDSIMVHPIPVASIAPVQNQCIDVNLFNFTNTGTFGNNASFSWSFGPDAVPPSSIQQNPANVVFTTPGQKSATLVISEYGCVSAPSTIVFNVYRLPDATWFYQGSAQCLDVNNYCLIANGTGNTPGAGYSWSIPNGNPSASNSQNACGINFSQAGNQNVILTVTDNGCVSQVSGIVPVLPNPVIDAGPGISFCQGEGGDTLNGSIIQTTVSPYYWTWWCDSTNTWCGLDSINDNDPLANPNQSTMYYAMVHDANGCRSNIDSAYVTVLPKPIVDAGPDLFICTYPAPGDQINATVSGAPGPYIYQWLPAAGLNNTSIEDPYARPMNTTVYYLLVTSSNGCQSDYNTLDTLSSVVVNVTPIPVANAGPDQDLCLNDNLTLNGQGTGGNGTYQYQWSPSSGVSNPTIPSPTVSPSLTTDYILTVISNGCPSIGDTMTVFVHTNPTVDAGPDKDICLGESATLNGNAWGDPTSTGYTYLWTPNQAINNNTLEDPTVNPVNLTTYYVVATSSWGCESDPDSTTVHMRPSPQVDAGENKTICYGTPITLQGTYTFGTTPTAPANQIFINWTPGTVLNDPTILTPSGTLTQTVLFTLAVNYQNCIDSDQVIITVLPDINANAEADTAVICSGDSVQLSVTGGQGNSQYQWIPSTGLSNPNSANPVASPGAPTSYQVIVSEGGCSDTSNVNLNVIPSPVAAFVNSTAEGCSGLEVSFLETSADALNWIWNFGDNTPVSNTQNPSHTYTTPGTYQATLTAVGPGNCQDVTEPVTITIYPQPVADFSSNPSYPVTLNFPETNVQFNSLSRDAKTWLWDFGDGESSGEKNPVHTFPDSGTFFVKLVVSGEGGCLDEVSHGPYIVVAPDVFVPNIFSPNGDGINDKFQIIYTGSQPFDLTIKDRWGTNVFQSKNKTVNWDGATAAGDAPEGVYYYALKIGDRSFVGNVTLVR